MKCFYKKICKGKKKFQNLFPVTFLLEASNPQFSEKNSEP